MRERNELTHGTDFGFGHLPLLPDSYVWKLASRGWHEAQVLVQKVRTGLAHRRGARLAARPFPTPETKRPVKSGKPSRRRAS
jgi:hypothetical protein